MFNVVVRNWKEEEEGRLAAHFTPHSNLILLYLPQRHVHKVRRIVIYNLVARVELRCGRVPIVREGQTRVS